MMLALEGAKRYREVFDLICRRAPGRLTPANQALAAPHPGHRVGLRQPAD